MFTGSAHICCVPHPPYSEKLQESEGHPFSLLGARKICPLPPEHVTPSHWNNIVREEEFKDEGGLVSTMPGGLRVRTLGQYFHSLPGTQLLVGAWQALCSTKTSLPRTLQPQRERTTV